MPRISIRQKLLRSLRNAISTIQKSIQLQRILKDNVSNGDNEYGSSTITIGMQELYFRIIITTFKVKYHTRSHNNAFINNTQEIDKLFISNSFTTNKNKTFAHLVKSSGS